jgi:arabinogalactan oligomer/maltooligosaccharide transport system substrate-binding protein
MTQKVRGEKMKRTHRQTRRRIEAALDGGYSSGGNSTFDAALTEHLAGCTACQAYAEQARTIDAFLTKQIPEAWQEPEISSLKIEQAIQTVRRQTRAAQTVNSVTIWRSLRHAWKWGIGLAGIAILIGVLYFGIILIPANTRAPGAAQPSLTASSAATQIATLTPTVTKDAQKYVRPSAGDWVAATDFGKFIMTVDSTGTRITKVDFQFFEWTWCGTSAANTSEVVGATDWPITGNEFTVYSTFDQNSQNTITLHGTYNPDNQRFSGTWEEASQGIICSSVWEALHPHSLTIWTVREVTRDHFQRWLEKYQAENPDLTITVDTIPYIDVEYGWKPALDAGGGPDLLLMVNSSNSSMLSDWGRHNLALPLTPYLSGKTGDFISPLITDFSVDGQLYGIPYSTDSVALYYNKALLPDPPSSLDELASLVQHGQKITMLQDYFSLFPFFTAFGGQSVDSDGRCIADQSEGVLQGIQYLQKLAQYGAVITDNPLTTSNLFKNGQAAMLIDGSWNYPVYQDALGENLGVALIPPGSAPAIQITGGNYWVVNPNSRNPQLAVDFALYLASHDAQGDMTPPDVPVRADLFDSIPGPMNIFLSSAAAGFPDILLTGNFNYFQGGIDSIFYGNVEAALALRDACKQMNFRNGK